MEESTRKGKLRQQKQQERVEQPLSPQSPPMIAKLIINPTNIQTMEQNTMEIETVQTLEQTCKKMARELEQMKEMIREQNSEL